MRTVWFQFISFQDQVKQYIEKKQLNLMNIKRSTTRLVLKYENK
jgi:hypothetical protein